MNPIAKRTFLDLTLKTVAPPSAGPHQRGQPLTALVLQESLEVPGSRIEFQQCILRAPCTMAVLAPTGTNLSVLGTW